MTAIASGPTLAEVRDTWPATVSIEQGSAAFGFSKSWGYELAAANEFPCRTIRIRGRTRVIVASLVRVLEGGDP